MPERLSKKPKKPDARKTGGNIPLHILIVEDEPAHVKLIRRGLLSSQIPYRLSCAGTLEEARAILTTDRPGLMVLDWLLPDGKGEALLPGNREDISFPVIVMTSHGDDALARHLLDRGVADYFTKSKAVFDDLPHIVDRTIRNWKIGQEYRTLERELTTNISILQTLINKPLDSITLLDKNGTILDLNTTLEGILTGFQGVSRNITERQHVETALRESEQRLRRFYESGLFGAICWTVDGKITDANDTFLRMIGYTRDDLLTGRINWLLMTPPEFQHEDELSIEELKATGVNKTGFEKEYIRKDGTRIPILVAGAMIDEERTRGIAIVLDITERKRAERALEESEEKYRILFSRMNEGNTLNEIVYDSFHNPVDYRILDVNKAFERIFGLEKDRIIGKTGRELFGAGTPLFINSYARVADGGEPEVFETYFEQLKKYLAISVYSPGKGRFATTFEDITDRKLADEALKESEEKFRSMVNASPDMIWEINRQGNFTYISSQCGVQLGYAPEDLIGKPIFSLIRPESVPAMTTEFFAHVQDKSSFTTIEVPANRRDGSLCIIEIRSVPITGNEGQLTGFQGIARDITDRKQAEEAVRDSQKRLGDILSFLPDAVLAIDNEGRVIAWNKAMEEMTGVAAADMLGKGNYEYSIPFYGMRRPILIDLILMEDTEIEKKYLFVHHDGEKIVSEVFIPEMNEGRGAHLWFIASPLYNTTGKRVGAIETIRDITERKQVEQALQESEERYRSVVEDQTEFICRFTPDGRITFVNDAYCRYFSLDKNQCIAKPHSVKLVPEDARIMKRHIASLTQENPVAIIEHRIIMSSGKIRWQRWSDRAIFDKDGLLIEYQSVGRDITEKKRAEEELRDSEMRYRSVIENAAEGIVVVQDGLVQYANTRALEMVDLSPEEIGNQQFTGFIHPEDRALVFDWYQRRIRGENVPQNYDFRIVGKSGQITWVQVSAVQISWNNQPATLNFLMDITDRNLMDAEIRSLNRVLEQRVADRTGQLNAMLTEKELLLREIHHRVKNNLQIIVSLFNLQSRYISDQKVLEVIRESQSRVRAMALVHERIYRSENVASVDLKEYLTFLGEQVFHYHGMKPSQIKLCLTMPEIRLDVDTVIPLGLVINELLSNSLKHAFPDGRKGTISILFSTSDEKNISLVFSDDGVGFPAGLDWKNSPSLGLRLVISLVRQLNGTIELDPSPVTTFRITATLLQPGIK